MITQQQQCYAAEALVPCGRLFDTVAEVQQFVDDLREQPWWTAQGFHLAVLRIEVGAAGHGKKNSVGWYDKSADAGRIELTDRGLRMRTVLHEVAHVIACAKYSSQSHDPWWARTYLTLVSYVMGADAYLALQSAFDRTGVDYDVTTTSRPGVIAL